MKRSFIRETVIRTKIDPDTKRVLSEKHFVDGQLHREGGPAVRKFSRKNGALLCEKWYRAGEMHRVDGPAVTDWDRRGSILYEGWLQKGKLHRDGDRPAEIYRRGSTNQVSLHAFFVDGVKHRDHGPASAAWDPDTGVVTDEEWFKNGQLHRPDGLPAQIERDENGKVFSKRYYEDGQLHREGGPAVVVYDYGTDTLEREGYWMRGVRVDAPSPDEPSI